jgi:general stress protein 26
VRVQGCLDIVPGVPLRGPINDIFMIIEGPPGGGNETGAFMREDEAVRAALDLAGRSEIVMIGTLGDDGYPNVKAMIKMENEGLNRIWLSTNASSRRVGQLTRNPKASAYFVDFNRWEGLMLVGDVEILHDAESKKRLWREGFERYYPQGVTDPDYSVLRFTARRGNYYHGLANVMFDVNGP